MHGVSAGFRKYGRAVTSYHRIHSELPQSPSAVDVRDPGNRMGEHPSILLPEHLVLDAPHVQSNGSAGTGLIRAFREVDDGVVLVALGMCAWTPTTMVVTTAVS